MDNIEELKCTMLDVLQNDDHTGLQKWKSSCWQYRLYIAAKIEERHLYEKNCIEKKSVNVDKMSKLQQEMSTIKSNIDSTILQQKIIDKKISNVIKSQESLQNEIDNAKTQNDALLLEMVDLELESEQRRKKKTLKWDAIKRACKIYKINLDIHIDLQEEKENCQHIKISFFTYDEETKDKYFVQLSHSNNLWRVEKIVPKIKKEHFKELNSTDLSVEHSKISDITLFLCQVRDVYLKYYMKKTRKKIE